MPVTTCTLTGNLADLAGIRFPNRQAVAVLETNSPHGEPLVLTNPKGIRFGVTPLTISPNGTFTQTGVVTTDSPNVMPEQNRQYRVRVFYPDPRTRDGQGIWDSGWFFLTGNADLADRVVVDYLPPTAIGQAVAVLNGKVADAEAALATYVADAEGYRNEARDISAIEVPADVMKVVDADPESDFRKQQDSRHLASIEAAVRPVLTAVPAVKGGPTPKAAYDTISAPQTSPSVITIGPGVFTDTPDWHPDYVTLRGAGQAATVVELIVPDSASDDDVMNLSPIKVQKDVTVEDVTFRTNARYAVHDEEANGNKRSRHTWRRVLFDHIGHDSINAWRAANPGSGLAPKVFNAMNAYGHGGASGQVVEFEDCTFRSPFTPYYVHNNAGFAEPMRVTHRRSHFISTSEGAPAGTIDALGSGAPDSILFEDCRFDALFMDLQDSVWYLDTIADHTVAMFPNYSRSDPIGHRDLTRGRALMVESIYDGTPGEASRARATGPAADLLFGTQTIRDGIGGGATHGYVYGDLDVSGITLGPGNQASTVNTLGKRLGNRTGSPAVMLMNNTNGHAVAYEFNTDYRAMSNADIITLLNANYPGFFFSIYHLSKGEKYPTSSYETTLVNADPSAAVQRWSAVKFGAGRRTVRPLLPDDSPGLFAGIALERALPGAPARILTEGYLSPEQLRAYGGPINAGTAVYHSDTAPGEFATTGTDAALTGAGTGWAYFRAPAA